MIFILLTLASYWRLLTFTFWKDDWFLLWGAFSNLRAMHQYWVHPATVVEFMWLTKLFGSGAIWWQLFGISLHIGVALSLSTFAQASIRSSAAGYLAGIFYSATVIGMDAVGWPSAHVVLISAIFLLTGMTNFIRYLREGKDARLILAVIYIGIGFISDPFRNFPVFLMLPLIQLTVTLSKARYKKYVRILELLLLFFVTMSIFGFGVFTKEILGSEFFKHMLALKSPVDVAKKLYVVGNYFNSIANLMFGWLIRFPEDASTGVYHRVWAVGGFVIGCASFVALKYYKKIAMLLFWIFIFYIPNWLFEPRLTMGVTHRYMVLSGLGFIVLIAYMISLLKNRTLRIVLALGFVLVNIWTANYYSTQADVYRSADGIHALWDRIDADVPAIDNLVFSYSGEDPLKTYGLVLSGAYPFAIHRKLTVIPVVTEDRAYLDKLLCKNSIPINHIFAWSVTNGGLLTNESMKLRRELLISTMAHDCVPVIDQLLIKNK